MSIDYNPWHVLVWGLECGGGLRNRMLQLVADRTIDARIDLGVRRVI